MSSRILLTCFLLLPIFWISESADCNFSYDSITFIETYEEIAVGVVLIDLKVEGTIGNTSSDIRLELIDETTYLDALTYFELSGKYIQWKTQYDLDVMIIDLIIVKVDCYLFSSPGSIVQSVTFHIDVYDINDNDPYFIGAPYSVNVSELWPPGIIIFDGIEADDDDIDTSPTELIFTYEGDGLENFKFTDKEELVADTELYLQPQTFYNFTLTVKDHNDDDKAGYGITNMYIYVIREDICSAYEPHLPVIDHIEVVSWTDDSKITVRCVNTAIPITHRYQWEADGGQIGDTADDNTWQLIDTDKDSTENVACIATNSQGSTIYQQDVLKPSICLDTGSGNVAVIGALMGVLLAISIVGNVVGIILYKRLKNRFSKQAPALDQL